MSKKFPPIAIFVLALIAIVFGATRILAKKTNSTSSSDTRVSVVDAKASQELNKEFMFPIINSSGKELTKIKMIIESAELRNEIVVQGRKANAVQGRTFLILNLKTTNSYSKQIQINNQDYFRLIVNGKSEELMAPDIHNDPLVLQATSTKSSRIGFAINDTDKDIKLRVGEVSSDKKETLDLNFQ